MPNENEQRPQAGVPGYPGGQPQQQWSGYAITSLVTGILGFACFLWLVGIGFGIAALRTIPRRNQRGRGMAIAGIVLSCLWLVALALIISIVGDPLFSQSNPTF